MRRDGAFSYFDYGLRNAIPAYHQIRATIYNTAIYSIILTFIYMD